jgi:hypothetical protein
MFVGCFVSEFSVEAFACVIFFPLKEFFHLFPSLQYMGILQFV